MVHIGFGRRNLDFPEHWEELDIEQIDNDEVIILCFGGNGVVDFKKATRFCATIERLCGLKNESDISSYNHLKLLGFYYNPYSDRPTSGEFNNEQRELIADQIFIKRCYDCFGNLKSEEELVKSFVKINIASHCWGAREASYIGGIVQRKLMNLGYSKETVLKAFSQIFHLTYAPYSDHTCFPCLRINSFVDSKITHMSHIYSEAYGRKLNGVAIQFDKPGRLRGTDMPTLNVPILSIYSSQLINIQENTDLTKLIDEHGVETLERDFDWKQGHQSHGARNADIVSQMASYAFADAVAVSIINKWEDPLIEKTPLEHLKTDLEDVLSQCPEEDLRTTLPI